MSLFLPMQIVGFPMRRLIFLIYSLVSNKTLKYFTRLFTLGLPKLRVCYNKLAYIVVHRVHTLSNICRHINNTELKLGICCRLSYYLTSPRASRRFINDMLMPKGLKQKIRRLQESISCKKSDSTKLDNMRTKTPF